jgi:hypothetical protein
LELLRIEGQFLRQEEFILEYMNMPGTIGFYRPWVWVLKEVKAKALLIMGRSHCHVIEMALTSYFWASPKNVSPDIAELPIIEAYITIITPLISIDIPPSHDLINYLWIWRYPIFDIF